MTSVCAILRREHSVGSGTGATHLRSLPVYFPISSGDLLQLLFFFTALYYSSFMPIMGDPLIFLCGVDWLC